MKYANQISIALTVVAALVTVYVLARTVFAPSPAAVLDLEALRSRYGAEDVPRDWREAETEAAVFGALSQTAARTGLVMPMGASRVSSTAVRTVSPQASDAGEGAVSTERSPVRRPSAEDSAPPGASTRDVRIGAPRSASESQDWRTQIRTRPGFPPAEAGGAIPAATETESDEPIFRPPAGAEDLRRNPPPGGPPVRGSVIPR